MQSHRRLVLLLAGILLAGGVLLLMLRYGVHLPQKNMGDVVVSDATMKNITLTDDQGKSVSPNDFLGTYTLIYFGFTHCPDICPLDVAKISAVLQTLRTHQQDVAAFFITLDPERDTPDVLSAYLQPFSPEIRGLTGSKPAIDTLVKAFHVAYEKQAKAGDSEITITHSGYVFLMDKQGKNSAIFAHDRTAEEIVQGIKQQLLRD